MDQQRQAGRKESEQKLNENLTNETVMNTMKKNKYVFSYFQTLRKSAQ